MITGRVNSPTDEFARILGFNRTKRRNVCFWHKADIAVALNDVCSWGKADITRELPKVRQ
jgi:hypothetical protein